MLTAIELYMSTQSPLTIDEADLILSLSDSELTGWLSMLPADRQTEVLNQLKSHRTATERATTSLYEFVRQAWPLVEAMPYIDNWHVQGICEHLEAVSRGEIMKLLINIPPGCSKSLLVCVFWMCWEWTHTPQARWMFNSYDQKLSTRDSVKCRALLTSPWYRERWGHKWLLANDQNQKIYYENDKGGYRLATTPGGHGTGEHPDRIVVDDPHNVRQAESEAERSSVLDWWDLTMPTRGASRNARRVIIMQRLHQSDLAGHVLEQGGWEHICLPMRYESGRMKATCLGWTDPRKEEGELLTPLFNHDKLAEIEKPMGAYGVAGQMQQRPAPRDGGMFKSDWFKIVPDVPAGLKNLVRAWDKAGSEDAGDYTCGVLMGEKDGIFYILDLVRGQWSSGKRDDQIDLVASLDDTEYGPNVQIWFEQEPGSGGKQSAEISINRLRGYRAFAEIATGTKSVRAEPFAIQCEVGNVRIVKAAWNRQFIDEHCVFPNGAHDDIVDAAGLAFRKLAKPRKRLLVGTG